jgi:hypothetical protein
MAKQGKNQEVKIRIQGRPYVPVFINDLGPFWLLLDTGCIGWRVKTRVTQRLALEVRT